MLHRGVPVGTFDPEVPAGPERRATDRTLPFDAVETAVDEIVRLERKCAARSAGLITEQDILRDLVRDALNALDFTEVVDLYRLTTQGVGPSPIGRLRTITGGSLRTERLAKALAAKTIETVGVDVLREAFATRRDRRKRDPDTQRRRREREQAPPGRQDPEQPDDRDL